MSIVADKWIEWRSVKPSRHLMNRTSCDCAKNPVDTSAIYSNVVMPLVKENTILIDYKQAWYQLRDYLSRWGDITGDEEPSFIAYLMKWRVPTGEEYVKPE